MNDFLTQDSWNKGENIFSFYSLLIRDCLPKKAKYIGIKFKFLPISTIRFKYLCNSTFPIELFNDAVKSTISDLYKKHMYMLLDPKRHTISIILFLYKSTIHIWQLLWCMNVHFYTEYYVDDFIRRVRIVYVSRLICVIG